MKPNMPLPRKKLQKIWTIQKGGESCKEYIICFVLLRFYPCAPVDRGKQSQGQSLSANYCEWVFQDLKWESVSSSLWPSSITFFPLNVIIYNAFLQVVIHQHCSIKQFKNNGIKSKLLDSLEGTLQSKDKEKLSILVLFLLLLLLPVWASPKWTLHWYYFCWATHDEYRGKHSAVEPPYWCWRINLQEQNDWISIIVNNVTRKNEGS